MSEDKTNNVEIKKTLTLKSKTLSNPSSSKDNSLLSGGYANKKKIFSNKKLEVEIIPSRKPKIETQTNNFLESKQNTDLRSQSKSINNNFKDSSNFINQNKLTTDEIEFRRKVLEDSVKQGSIDSFSTKETQSFNPILRDKHSIQEDNNQSQILKQDTLDIPKETQISSSQAIPQATSTPKNESKIQETQQHSQKYNTKDIKKDYLSIKNINEVTFKPIIRKSYLDEIEDVSSNNNIKSTANTKKADFSSNNKIIEEPEVLIEDDDVLVLKKKNIFAEKKRQSQELKKYKNYSLESDALFENPDEVKEEDLEVEENKIFFRKKRKNKFNRYKKDKIYKTVKINSVLTAKDIAVLISEKLSTVLKALISLGIRANENTEVEPEIAELVINDLGHNAVIDNNNKEEEILFAPSLNPLIKERPPVVTIMGHVDHGKTSLLDFIKKTKVASTEKGGITQHLGAYQAITKNNKVITFLDTPGHEAFKSIRNRGADITDIIIIVIAADDGIKDQTIEAINHVVKNSIPVIIAINKIDKPENNASKIKLDLLKYNLVSEDMGGEVQVVEVSAKTGLGIDNLLDAILLQAEILELKADFNTKGSGRILEVKLEKGLGTIATVIIEDGMVNSGDCFIHNQSFGKIKIMQDFNFKAIKQATPSTPVIISGFTDFPKAGDDFFIVSSEKEAKDVINYRISKTNKINEVKSKNINIANLLNTTTIIKTVLNVVVKADSHGSLDAILDSLAKITHNEITLKIIHSGIGDISESDVNLTSIAGNVLFLGFNVKSHSNLSATLKKHPLNIRFYSIIYQLLDDVKLMMADLLEPDVIETKIGTAEIRQIFNISKFGKIAGSHVLDGIIKKSEHVKIHRGSSIIYTGALSHIKREKDEVKEVKTGYDCGLSFEKFEDFQEKDIVECFEKKLIKKVVL